MISSLVRVVISARSAITRSMLGRLSSIVLRTLWITSASSMVRWSRRSARVVHTSMLVRISPSVPSTWSPMRGRRSRRLPAITRASSSASLRPSTASPTCGSTSSRMRLIRSVVTASDAMERRMFSMSSSFSPVCASRPGDGRPGTMPPSARRSPVPLLMMLTTVPVPSSGTSRRITAFLWSTRSRSTSICTSTVSAASPAPASVMSATLPTFTPPTRTSAPGGSRPALSESSNRTTYCDVGTKAEARSLRMAVTITANATAAIKNAPTIALRPPGGGMASLLPSVRIRPSGCVADA